MSGERRESLGPGVHSLFPLEVSSKMNLSCVCVRPWRGGHRDSVKLESGLSRVDDHQARVKIRASMLSS